MSRRWFYIYIYRNMRVIYMHLWIIYMHLGTWRAVTHCWYLVIFPNAWVTKTHWVLYRGGLVGYTVFMISYILRSSCFCGIWTLCVVDHLWPTYITLQAGLVEHSLVNWHQQRVTSHHVPKCMSCHKANLQLKIKMNKKGHSPVIKTQSTWGCMGQNLKNY